MTKLPLHRGAHDGLADRLAHDETRTHRRSVLPGGVRVRGTALEMDYQQRATRAASSAYCGREVLAPPQPVVRRQHGVMTCTGSGGQTGATLVAARRENRAAGTGTHPQPEAVGLGATTVVRLEGALAHSGAPVKISRWRASPWLSPCAHE
ncbi:putative ribonuclease P [Streptomyces sp. Tu6071]|nr:putative ribonuclease P [Streptomyces sp. Tu6071]